MYEPQRYYDVWYVVNTDTGLRAAGPFDTKAEALSECRALNEPHVAW